MPLHSAIRILKQWTLRNYDFPVVLHWEKEKVEAWCQPEDQLDSWKASHSLTCPAALQERWETKPVPGQTLLSMHIFCSPFKLPHIRTLKVDLGAPLPSVRNESILLLLFTIPFCVLPS